MRSLLIILALALATMAAAQAQIWIMSPASQMSGRGGSSPPSTNNLLANTGSKLLANTGSAILIQ